MSQDDIQERIKAQLRPQLPKRFYETVEVCKAEGGYGVLLDGRGIKTAAHKALVLPRRALAEPVAREWREQGEFIEPSTMPMTRLANTALDLVAVNPESVRAEILGYAGNDLVCYRAASPKALVERQEKYWSPILARVTDKLGVVFKTTTGMSHVEQSEAALAAIRGWLECEGAFSLAAIHTLTTLTGSALMSWALAQGGLAEDLVWQAAHVDEDWQSEHWGVDDEAQRRREAKTDEFMAAARFLSLAKN